MRRYATLYTQRPPFHQTRYPKQVIIMQEEPKPSPRMKNLLIFCQNGYHPLPEQMVLIGVNKDSKYGFQYVYACPKCNHREGWIIGYDGQPFCLFRK
jgi:hypothetical protein